MTKHNLLKKISLGIASLALICPLALGGISNSTVANAKRRARTHRTYRYHESKATWYKNNAVRLYYRYRHNHAFKDGYRNALHGVNDSTSAYITREYAYSNKYKYGWIIGLTRRDIDPDNYFSARYDLKSAFKFHYKVALDFWNGGMHYLHRYSNAHSTRYNAEDWVNGDED